MKNFYKSIDKILKNGYAIISGKIVNYKRIFMEKKTLDTLDLGDSIWQAYNLFLAGKLLQYNPSTDKITILVLFSFPESIGQTPPLLQAMQKILSVVRENKIILPDESVQNIMITCVNKNAEPSAEILILKENQNIFSNLIYTIHKEFSESGVINKLINCIMEIDQKNSAQTIKRIYKTKFRRIYKDSNVQELLKQINSVWGEINKQKYVVKMKNFEKEIDLRIDERSFWHIDRSNKHDNISGGVLSREIETKGAAS